MEYSPTAWEQAMRMQDVILRAISGEIHWFQAAEILQMTPRRITARAVSPGSDPGR